MTTDEKKPSEATEAEKKAHVLGLLKSTARLVAHMASITADLAESSGRPDDAIALVRDGRALLVFLEQIEAGIYRGRVNDNVRTAPGAIVRRAESMAELGAALAELPDAVVDAALSKTPSAPKPRGACEKCGRMHTRYGACVAPSPQDYEREGGPPPNWRALKDDEPTE